MRKSLRVVPDPQTLVTLETSASVFEVIAALDAALHRELGGLDNIAKASANPQGKDRETLLRDLRVASGGGPVMFFSDYRYDEWISAYGGRHYPVTYHYVVGNPVMAESFMRHDILAALTAPPRIIITERERGAGARLVYYLPSTTVDQRIPALVKAAQVLDEKLEELLQDLGLPDVADD